MHVCTITGDRDELFRLLRVAQQLGLKVMDSYHATMLLLKLTLDEEHMGVDPSWFLLVTVLGNLLSVPWRTAGDQSPYRWKKSAGSLGINRYDLEPRPLPYHRPSPPPALPTSFKAMPLDRSLPVRSSRAPVGARSSSQRDWIGQASRQLRRLHCHQLPWTLTRDEELLHILPLILHAVTQTRALQEDSCSFY